MTNSTSAITTGQQTLIEAYQNGNLLTKQTSRNGNPKGLSFQRIGKYLGLPFEALIKPFNVSIGPEKYKYEATVIRWDDTTYELLLNAREVYQNKPETIRLIINTNEHNRFTFEVTDEEGKPFSRKPFADSAYRTIPARLIGASMNLPLIALYKRGQVSEKRLAQVLFSWIVAKADKKQVKLDRETQKVLGQILFTNLMTNPAAEYFTPKEFLENQFRLNWGIIRDASSSSRETTGLLPLPTM